MTYSNDMSSPKSKRSHSKKILKRAGKIGLSALSVSLMLSGHRVCAVDPLDATSYTMGVEDGINPLIQRLF